MTVLRLFNYKTEPAGIGEKFGVGEYPNIEPRMTVEYVDQSNNRVTTGLQVTSFILHKGYGATFYEGVDFRNSFRTILAGEGDVTNTFTGDDRYDRSIRGMKFERSSDTMVDNIRSIKVFALPTKKYCERSKISDRDLCENAYGSGVFKTLSDINKTPTLGLPGEVASDDTEYTPEPTGMSEAESLAWLAQQTGEAQNNNVVIGLGVLATAIVGYLLIPSGSPPPRRRR